MKKSGDWKRSGWFWVGATLLCLVVAPLWLVFIGSWVTKPDIANIIVQIVFLILLTAVPVGTILYGIYGVKHDRRQPPVEIKLSSEPTYPSQPAMKPAQTDTGFFGRLREKLRDKVIDKLCDDLCALGLDARMAERRRPEEKMILNPGKSLGLIEIRDCPIHWVNVRKHAGDQYTSDAYTNVYLVPDRRVPRGGYLELKSVRVKSVPVIGRVVDFRWEAKFVKVKIKSMPVLTGQSVPVKMDSNLIERLNEDVPLKESLIRLEEDITIRSLEDWGWAISTSVKSTQPTPSQEQWDRYETIARHLLEAS